MFYEYYAGSAFIDEASLFCILTQISLNMAKRYEETPQQTETRQLYEKYLRTPVNRLRCFDISEYQRMCLPEFNVKRKDLPNRYIQDCDGSALAKVLLLNLKDILKFVYTPDVDLYTCNPKDVRVPFDYIGRANEFRDFIGVVLDVHKYMIETNVVDKIVNL